MPARVERGARDNSVGGVNRSHEGTACRWGGKGKEDVRKGGRGARQQGGWWAPRRGGRQAVPLTAHAPIWAEQPRKAESRTVAVALCASATAPPPPHATVAFSKVHRRMSSKVPGPSANTAPPSPRARQSANQQPSAVTRAPPSARIAPPLCAEPPTKATRTMVTERAAPEARRMPLEPPASKAQRPDGAAGRPGAARYAGSAAQAAGSLDIERFR